MGVLMNPDILNTIVNTCDVKWHITSLMRLVCKDWKRIVSHATPSLLDLCVPPRELLFRDYKYEFIREMNDQQYYSWAVDYFGSRCTKTQLANFILCLPAAKVRELNPNNDRNVAMMDTKVAQGDKANPEDVAKAGYAAMKRGDGDVVAGLGNKVQAAMAAITPQTVLAERHRKMAEPGSGA